MCFIFSTQMSWDFKCGHIQWFFFFFSEALTWRCENWFKVHSWPWRQQLQKKQNETKHKVHLRGTLESLIMWHNHCYQMEVIVRVRNITSPKSWRVQDNLIFVFSFFPHWCIWRRQRLENIFREMPLFWWWATQEMLVWGMRSCCFFFSTLRTNRVTHLVRKPCSISHFLVSHVHFSL